MKKRHYLQPATEVVATDTSATLLGGSLTNEAETETTGVYEEDDAAGGTIIGLSRILGN